MLWLLANGADPNAGFQYDTALSRAVLIGSLKIVRMLLSHGGDVKRGQVLHWVMERHEYTYEVLTFLLERGASPNEVEFDRVLPVWSVLHVLGTPLHKAITLDIQDVVAKPLEYGADSDKQDTSAKTAGVMAAELGLGRMVSLMQWQELHPVNCHFAEEHLADTSTGSSNCEKIARVDDHRPCVNGV